MPVKAESVSSPRPSLAEKFYRPRPLSQLPPDDRQGLGRVAGEVSPTKVFGGGLVSQGKLRAMRRRSLFDPAHEAATSEQGKMVAASTIPSAAPPAARSFRRTSSGGGLGARIGAFFQFKSRPGARGRSATVGGEPEEKMFLDSKHLRSFSVPQPSQVPASLQANEVGPSEVLIEGVCMGAEQATGRYFDSQESDSVTGSQTETGILASGAAPNSEAEGPLDVVDDKDNDGGTNSDTHPDFYHGRILDGDNTPHPPPSSLPAGSSSSHTTVVGEDIDAQAASDPEHPSSGSPAFLASGPSSPPQPSNCPNLCSNPSSLPSFTRLDDVQPCRPHIDSESVSSTRLNLSNLSGPLNTSCQKGTTVEVSVAIEESLPRAPLGTGSPPFPPSGIDHEEVVDTSQDPQLAPVPAPPSPQNPAQTRPETVGSSVAQPRELDFPFSAVAMLSSSRQQTSVSASGHPRYAHLYSQGQGSSGHQQLPHSHHGHGSQGISFLPHPRDQVPQRSGSPGVLVGQRQDLYPVAGTSTMAGQSGFRTVGGGKQQQQTPGSQGHAAAKANLKAWWNQFNFVKGIKKDNPEEQGGLYRFLLLIPVLHLLTMPTLSSLTRSLTLPLNRKRAKRSNTTSAVTSPIDERPSLDFPTPAPIAPAVSTPPALPRRQNSFLGIKTPANNNGGIFNLNLDGLLNPNAKSNPIPEYVVPPYVAPDSASPQNVVFGKPLKESLKYASVQISTANANGDLYVWGYIPVVVAKCGLYLKENATEVPGTFRVNGSNRRMRELQAAFESPPRYGKNLDWKQETYTTHDVASVFRRYLTQMPEPVIPYDLYHQFRDALGREPVNQDDVIAKYKALIRQMPRSNQYLLLYVLDLLSVFARKSDKNLMTATNLAVIFRPGLMSHPQHEMSPHEHALSQRVLEFLIAHQDWFMLDIPPPPGRRGSGQQVPQQQSSQQSQLPPPSGENAPIHERRPSDFQHQHKFVYPIVTSSSPPATPLGTPNQQTALQTFQQQQQMHQEQVLAANPWVNPAAAAASANNSLNVSSIGRLHILSSSAFAPRKGRPLSDIGSETTVDDVMVIPKGDGEQEEFSGVGGGWKLVSKAVGGGLKDSKEKERLKMVRRRSTMERSGLMNRGSLLAEDDMTSPTLDLDSPILSSGPGGPNSATVQRSRTLPSSRRKNSNSPNGSTLNASEIVLSASTGKENVGVQFAAVLDGNGQNKLGGKEKRSVLVKKSRRGSSSVSGDHKEQRIS